uniref:Uncharacterized protein n=1 Tax=Oryza nivara TaxID=4536 RepID=A0A0E0HSM8_ORYNI
MASTSVPCARGRDRVPITCCMRCPWTRYQGYITHVIVKRIQAIIETHPKRNAPRALSVAYRGMCTGRINNQYGPMWTVLGAHLPLR